MEHGILQPKIETESIFEFKDVDKIFVADSGRRVEAVAGIDLDIRSGRLITIVGPTGSGKSTLLNLAAGMEEATKGSISYQDSFDLKKDMAYVFQHYTLLPWRTVLKNVSFGLQLRGIEKQRRNAIAAEWIERVGLGGFERAYPHELSGGMRQRAAIAQALAIKPKLLIMDEPFGSLDDAMRADLQSMLIDLQQQSQTTILFVTHNIDEAIFLADQIFILSKSPGTILEKIDVNIERPRDKTSKNYSQLFIKIRNMIT